MTRRISSLPRIPETDALPPGMVTEWVVEKVGYATDIRIDRVANAGHVETFKEQVYGTRGQVIDEIVHQLSK